MKGRCMFPPGFPNPPVSSNICIELYPQHTFGRPSANICCPRSAPYKLPLHQMTGPVGRALLFPALLPARSLGSRGPALEPPTSGRAGPEAEAAPGTHHQSHLPPHPPPPNDARVTSPTTPVICLGDPPYLQQTQEGLEHNLCGTATETC